MGNAYNVIVLNYAQGEISMNPKKSKTRKIIIILIIIAFLAGGAFAVWKLFFTKEEKTAITGSTTKGALYEAIEGSGTTTPVDSVSYDVMGTVLEWYAQPGAEVKEGDLLYVLDSSDAEDQILDFELELEDLYKQLADINENVSNQRVTADFAGRIENVTAEEGDNVQNGRQLAKLVDDSIMKATLYFSYIYQDEIYVGMDAVLSVPDQMMDLPAKVTDIKYVDYVTTEGLRCFAVSIAVENPGSLTEGTTVSAWMTASDGSEMYPAADAKLQFNQFKNVVAKATGELSSVNVVDYERVGKGQLLFTIDASTYESQIENVNKQIENFEDKIADLRESIETEYSRYADISGTIVTASYSSNRMTGMDMGSVVIYNQDSMQISINIDELDADYCTQGMDVTVYRTTSSRTEYYPATLTYLSLEASSGSSGVSTFAATITIDSDGQLSSGVTVYYSIDTSGNIAAGQMNTETVLAPLNSLCSYNDGYYLLVACDSKPENAIDPASTGGSVTDYPDGYYAIPVEVGDFNSSYIQVLSGVEEDATLFMRWQNSAPTGGDSTSLVQNEDGSGFTFDFNNFDPSNMPDGFSFPGGNSNGGGGGGGFSFPGGGSGGGGGGMPSGGGFPGQ